MFAISVETQFRASHQLNLRGGAREPLHYHNWHVTAQAAGPSLNAMGVVMDFHRLKSILDGAVADLDNDRLSSIPFFQQNNASAENVARHIYQAVEKKLPEGVSLRSVKVIEETGCAAEFQKPSNQTTTKTEI